MSSKREIRTIRIEDWEGNVYRPEGVGSGGTSGTIVSPSQNDKIETDGTIITDDGSSGSVIMVQTDPTTEKNIATGYVSDLVFGDYSVAVRLKSSNNTATSNIVRIRTYYSVEGQTDVLLSTTYITANKFKAANTYQTFVFITTFKGVVDANQRLKIEVTSLPITTSSTICLDYFTVDMAAGSMLNTVTTLS